MLPIAPIVFLVYIMLRYELFGHLDVAAITNSPWLESFYLEKVGLRSCVESLFITTWFSTDITAYSFWHIWGALLTVYGVWNIKTLQNWLEKPCFCFLGKISYSVYIIHIPLIYSFSMYVFQFMFHGANIGYLGSALGTIAVTTAAVIFLAWLYQRYVENGCNKILQIVFKRIKKQEKS
jgi:peptidoglycan/LPS O-acetylase OafA/YrhL